MPDRLFFSWIFLIISFTVYAQKDTISTLGFGSLSGTVTEAETGTTLPIANVILKQHDTIIIIGSTDLEGEFKINPISEGVYDVEVTFAGYKTLHIPAISISPGGDINIDFQLSMHQGISESIIVSCFGPGVLFSKNHRHNSTTFEYQDIKEMGGRY